MFRQLPRVNVMSILALLAGDLSTVPTRVILGSPANAVGPMSPLSAKSVLVVSGVFPGTTGGTQAMVGADGRWSVCGRVVRALATTHEIRELPRQQSRAPALGWTRTVCPQEPLP